MPRIDFLKETLDVLSKNGKSPSDVLYVRSLDNQCSFNEFRKKIKNFKYNNGFGSEEINVHLVIVGTNWWMERALYDGSEWWEFDTGEIDFQTNVDSR